MEALLAKKLLMILNLSKELDGFLIGGASKIIKKFY